MITINTQLLSIMGILLSILLLKISRFIWKQLRLYCYSWQFQGPFALPIIGNLYLFQEFKGIYENLVNLCHSQPNIFRLWIGWDLLIVSTRRDDIDIVLNKFNNKGKYYKVAEPLLGDSLLITKAETWKIRRKIISPSFNAITLNSFMDTFVKHSNNLVQKLNEKCDKGSFDVLSIILNSTLDVAIENLIDIDSELIIGKNKLLDNMRKLSDLIVFQMCNIFNHVNFLKKLTSTEKEINYLNIENNGFIKKMISAKTTQLKELGNGNTLKEKRFLNHLLNVYENSDILNEDAFISETKAILIGASETTATALSNTLLILGMFPEVQEKIHQELENIFQASDRNATLYDLSKMNYLEWVLKESMRMLPVVPFVARYIDEDIKLGTYLVPAGSHVVIPIVCLHHRADIYKDPFKFKPERFSQEYCDQNVHKWAWLTFGCGPRNCIGGKYAMMLMKVVLSTVLRHYRFHSPKQKTIEEIKLFFSILAKNIDGYEISLSKKKLT